MFNNYGMEDHEILESAEEVCNGKLILSLEDLSFLLNRTIDLTFHQKVEDRLILGILREQISAADLDDDDEAEVIFEAIVRIQRGKMDEPAQALDIAAESGISFTETRYFNETAENLRDYLLSKTFSAEIVKRMIRLGIDINQPLLNGCTPAYIAADRAFQPKSSWEEKGQEEELAKAAAFFSRESMEALNAHGTSAVHRAIRNHHVKMLQVMTAAGIDVNLSEDYPAVTGFSLLHTACLYGYPEIVSILTEAGADDTRLSGKEESPAHTALFCHYVTGSKRLTIEERAALIKALKHIDVPGKDGRTPMMTALTSSDYDIRRNLPPVFLEKGADVNHRDNDGNTPLILGGDIDMVKALVEAGADVNARNSNGDTPLHRALEEGRIREAKYLLRKGADYNVPNNSQVTPIQIAVEKGMDEVLQLME